MKTNMKKPWVKPEVAKLKPTRELLSLFPSDAQAALAVPIEQKK